MVRSNNKRRYFNTRQKVIRASSFENEKRQDKEQEKFIKALRKESADIENDELFNASPVFGKRASASPDDSCNETPWYIFIHVTSYNINF